MGPDFIFFKYESHIRTEFIDPNNEEQTILRYKVRFKILGKIEPISLSDKKLNNDLINEIIRTCLDTCIISIKRNISFVISEKNMF